MSHYIGRFSASTDVQTAVDNGDLLKPYVAYVDGVGLDYNSLQRQLHVEWVGATGDTYQALKTGGVAVLSIRNAGNWTVLAQKQSNATPLKLSVNVSGTGDTQVSIELVPNTGSTVSAQTVDITAYDLAGNYNAYAYYITPPADAMTAPTVVWTDSQDTAITVSAVTTATTIEITSMGDWDALSWMGVTATTTGTYTYEKSANKDKFDKTTNISISGYVGGVGAATGVKLSFTQEGNPNVSAITIEQSFTTTASTNNVGIGNGANKSDEIWLKDASTSDEWSRVKSATGSSNTKINFTHIGTDGEPETHLVRVVYYSAAEPASPGSCQGSMATDITAATSSLSINPSYNTFRNNTNLSAVTFTSNVVNVSTNVFLAVSALSEIHLLHTTALPTVTDQTGGNQPMFSLSGQTGTLYVDNANVTGLSAWTDALGENWTVSYVNQ